MAKKKIVEIDEEMLKGIMVSDVPVFGRASKTPEPPEAEVMSNEAEAEPEPADVAPVTTTEPTKNNAPPETPINERKKNRSNIEQNILSTPLHRHGCRPTSIGSPTPASDDS